MWQIDTGIYLSRLIYRSSPNKKMKLWKTFLNNLATFFSKASKFDITILVIIEDGSWTRTWKDWNPVKLAWGPELSSNEKKKQEQNATWLKEVQPPEGDSSIIATASSSSLSQPSPSSVSGWLQLKICSSAHPAVTTAATNCSMQLTLMILPKDGKSNV